MANYRDAQKTSFSSSEEKRFRKIFNDWAASIKGYDRKNIGNDIKILEVWDSPLYRGLLKTQYDNRILENVHERLSGRSLPGKAPVHESQIDRWSLVDFPKEFTSKNSYIRIEGSEYVNGCHTCSATGKVVCPKCGGKGTVEHKIVNKVACSSCDGRGYTTKMVTYTSRELVWNYSTQKNYYKDVTRQREERVHCRHCNGSGKVESISYQTVRCGYCSATGRVSCDTCGGEGRLFRRWRLNHTLYVKKHVDYRFPTQIAIDEVSKMIKLLDDSTPWRVVERVRVENENFKAAALGSREVVGGMLSRLPDRVEHPQNTVACFSDVEVCECEAKTVIYELEGIRFTCLLVGSEWKLFTVTSPVSKRMDDLKEMVNNYCSKRQYGKAWAALQKVNKYPQAGSNEAYMQEQLEERMSLVTRLGANLSIVISAVLVAPLLYVLYGEYGFLAPWCYWLEDQIEVGVTGTMVITVIFVMFASIRYCKRGLPAFSYRAASSMRRFIRGFFVGVFCTLYFTGIAVFLGYMGLLQLALGLLGLVLSIVIFVIMLIAFLVTSIF